MAQKINENCKANVIAGLPKDCATSMGGVKAVWMAPSEDVASVAEGKTSGETDNGIIGTITMASPEKKFVRYNFRKGTASMSSQLNIDQANGVNYVTTTLTLSFLRMETQKRIEMSALAVNDLMIIVEDCNGVYWLLGKDEPVTATGGTGETGTARTDGNKYTITLQDDSVTFPYEVTAEALKAVDADQAGA